MPISAATSLGVNGPRPPRRAGHALRDLGQQPVPAADELAHGRGDLRVRPAGRDHLLEHADVARLEVLLEEVARLLPLAPQRLGPGVHRALALEEAGVLALEDGEDELLLAAEVVVDLAERDLGGLGDGRGSRGSRSRRRAGVVPGGGEDGRAGVGRRPIAALGARLGCGNGLVHVVTRIRPHQVTDATE